MIYQIIPVFSYNDFEKLLIEHGKSFVWEYVAVRRDSTFLLCYKSKETK